MSVYISVTLQRRVRERFADICAYCHSAEALTVVTFEFEHIVPLAAGGHTAFKNLCLACPSCNRYKAAKVTVPKDDGEDIALFHPQKDPWYEHFAWDESKTLLLPLTDTANVTIRQLRMNREQLRKVRALWVKLGLHPPNVKLSAKYAKSRYVLQRALERCQTQTKHIPRCALLLLVAQQ